AGADQAARPAHLPPAQHRGYGKVPLSARQVRDATAVHGCLEELLARLCPGIVEHHGVPRKALSGRADRAVVELTPCHRPARGAATYPPGGAALRDRGTGDVSTESEVRHAWRSPPCTGLRAGAVGTPAPPARTRACTQRHGLGHRALAAARHRPVRHVLPDP